jgi:hypothetical protein
MLRVWGSVRSNTTAQIEGVFSSRQGSVRPKIIRPMAPRRANESTRERCGLTRTCRYV